MQIWFKFDDENDEDPTYTANVTEDENGNGTLVEWWHEDVGLTERVIFEDEDTAGKWLESQGFQDFTA